MNLHLTLVLYTDILSDYLMESVFIVSFISSVLERPCHSQLLDAEKLCSGFPMEVILG